MFFLIKALLFTAFLILKSNLAFANTPMNYEQYDKLPCKFNGAEVGNSAYPRTEKDKSYSYKINRCTKPRRVPKNIRKFGRNGKEATDINVKWKTPIVAVRDMEFFFAQDYSAKNRCKEHKNQNIGEINITLPDPLNPKEKRKCITPYENIQITFKDKLNGDYIVYKGLSSTPLVPGFDQGKCKRPYMQDRKENNLGNLAGLLKGARFDHICGGPIKTNIKKGEIIGYSGKRGKYSSFGFNIKKMDQPYIIAPEDNLAWENFPNDKNRFLIPVLNDSQLETLKMVSKKIVNAEKNKKEFDKKIENEAKKLIVKNQTTNENLKSAMDIDKKQKIKFRKSNNTGYWQFMQPKLNDLRGDGFVYYVFEADTYTRISEDFKILSKGNYVFTDKKQFKLQEGDQEYFWKISLSHQVIDIKSKFYDYKGFKRFEFRLADVNEQDKIKEAIEAFDNQKYAKIDESDDNLNRLYKLIIEDEYFLKKNKYLKYSKKGKYNGKEIKTMGLAVFINYEKELSKLTKDINSKDISPLAWGWEYSHEDKVDFSGWKAIQKCYAHVKKRKLRYTDGECLVVDFRRIKGGSENPIISENYLFKERDNRILIAKKSKESEKTKEQIENEKKKEKKLLAKKKKEAEEKEKKLQLAQKKAEEERIKQEKILLAKKKEEEKRKKELLIAQKKAKDEKKRQELLLAQKKAEEERIKQELLLAQKKAEEEKKKQELLAQQKAEEERKKQEELAKKKAIEDEKRQKLLAEEKKKKEELLAKLKAEEEEELKKIELAKEEAEKEFKKKKKELNVDKDSPEILVAETVTVSNQVYKLKGKVKDKSDFFLEIDGQPVKINAEGEFVFEGFIIDTDAGEELTLVAVDRWNNSSEKNVKINVEIKEIQVAKSYEKLSPNKVNAKQDINKIALVIGVEKYKNLSNLDAIYANRDAKAFRAYANRAFGIPLENIKVLIDNEASRAEMIKAIKLWLPQIAKGGGKDIYIFFAGHGLASDDGENLFLLPQDGDSLLLEDTALLRSDIFKQISKLKPNSVTIFFDTCYSGQTRTEETLIAGLRPVRLVVEEQEIPNNFTIFSASSLTQTSGSIEQAKHGIFSYYLMKGLEGNADSNKDQKITNGELIAYLKQNVSEEAFINNRQQEPMLSGDPNKVLISYR